MKCGNILGCVTLCYAISRQATWNGMHWLSRAYLTLRELLPFKLTLRNILWNCGIINVLFNRRYSSHRPPKSRLFPFYDWYCEDNVWMLRYSVYLFFYLYSFRSLSRGRIGFNRIEKPKTERIVSSVEITTLLFHYCIIFIYTNSWWFYTYVE